MSGFWNADTMRRRISAEKLVVPYFSDHVTCGAYELCLGRQVYVTGSEKKTKEVIDQGQQIRVPPGQFANLLTEEIITVPRDALGMISVKFGLKQRGLVNVSGFHVDPGYSGYLLFSVYNAGPTTVRLARGEPAFLLWFAAFDSPTPLADLYKGTHSARGITSEDVMRLQGEIASPQALAIRVKELEDWRRRFNVGWLMVASAVVGVLIAWVAPSGDLFGGHSSTTTTTAVTSRPAPSLTTSPTITTAPPAPTTTVS